MQYAIHRLGFKPEQIVVMGWSIGGYAATWLAMNYPDIKGLVRSCNTVFSFNRSFLLSFVLFLFFLILYFILQYKYSINLPKAVLRIRIRIHRIHMFLGLLDPDLDPFVRGMDPDPSIIKQK